MKAGFSAAARTHPLLWMAVAAMAGMTAIVVTSSLPVILDAVLHDDSFYYLAVAENLARGNGSTFDGINYTNGYQPAWFAILASLYALGVAHDGAVPIFITLQAALYIAGLLVLADAFVRTGVERASAAVAIGVVFVGLVPGLGWNLLETGLTVLASASLINVLTREDASPASIGLAVSLAGLARTDHLLFIPIVALLFALRARRVTFADVVGFSTPVAILVGGYLVLNLVTTGHIMPVSGRVKDLYSSAWNLGDTLRQLASFDVRQSWKIGVVVAIAVIGQAVVRRRPAAIAAYAVGALGIFAYYQLRYATHFSAAFWYYVPLYVLFAFGLARGFDALTATRISRSAAATAMAIVLIGVLGARTRLLLSYRDRAEGERAQAFRVAEHLRTRMVSPEARAAAWDAGILGYYAGRVTNLDGLVNSAEYLERYLTRAAAAEYVREQQFDFLVCYEPDLMPGGKAASLVDEYRRVYDAYSLVILERVEKNR